MKTGSVTYYNSPYNTALVKSANDGWLSGLDNLKSGYEAYKQFNTISGMTEGQQRDEAYRKFIDSSAFTADNGIGNFLSNMPYDVKMRVAGKGMNFPGFGSAPVQDSPYAKKLLWGVTGAYGQKDIGDYLVNLTSSLAGNVPTTYLERMKNQVNTAVDTAAPTTP